VVPGLAARTNGFGFTITGASGMAVVVEACTDLGAPLWSPVGTNRLADGFSHFSDPQWTNSTRRFYRLSGTTLGDRPTVLWNPRMQTRNPRFGGQNNQFGINITGTADIPIVLEACSNLATANWTVLQACTLTNGSIYFSEPDWTNYPARFYRIRSP
jgi:hypothetical protein